MVKRLAVLLALTGLVACSPDEPEPAVEAPAPEGPAEPEAAEGLRPPSSGEVDCSDPPPDPAQIDLFAENAGANREAAIRGLQTLAGEHPTSATARARLGELYLAHPSRPEQSDVWFTRALELHERGCELSERDHWLGHEGQAISRMMRNDYDNAIAPLRASIERWPGSRSTHYNLACALCRTGDLDGCVAELQTVLSDLEPPTFLEEDTRSVEHFRAQIQSDPDLAPLRADEARLASVLD